MKANTVLTIQHLHPSLATIRQSFSNHLTAMAILFSYDFKAKAQDAQWMRQSVHCPVIMEQELHKSSAIPLSWRLCTTSSAWHTDGSVNAEAKSCIHEANPLFESTSSP